MKLNCRNTSDIFAAGMIAGAVMFATIWPAEAAQTGRASWYSHAGKKTASGERANPAGLTAAHRSLPFGTRVKVRNLRNGRTVTVRINDRGPFVRGRIIDVTKAAARRLGFMRRGTARVRIQPVRR